MAEDFDWNRLGLNKHQFTAYANLLALRNGGQVEAASLGNEILDEDEPDDESDAATIDTSRLHQISNSGHYRLKKKFLDCLAELTANKKGGRSVACSSMMEGEETVTLWITRNGGFQNTDNLFFERLSGLLYSKDTADQAAEKALWNEMLAYYKDRLESDFIPDLRASLKGCNSFLDDGDDGNSTTARHELLVLRELTFDVVKSGQKLIDRHDTLVTKAYEIRMMKAVKEMLQISATATNRTRKLWVDICFLGRLRVAFQTFKKTCLELPSFNKVTIVPVPSDVVFQGALKGALNLKETFKLLGLLANDSTIKAVIGPKWTTTKAEQDFAKTQKQKLSVHAEVQMIIHLIQTGQSFNRLLPYFGCSKYSCFMCSHFLKAHGRIGTRGCHGRLFRPWTVPEATALPSGQADKLAKAVIQLQNDITKELKSDFKKVIPMVKTSVVGGSSVFSNHKTEKTQRQLDIERRIMKMEQERVAQAFAGSFKGLSMERSTSPLQHLLFTDPSDSASAAQKPNFVPDQLAECRTCEQMTSRRCSVCKKDFYCSESCETKRSDAHRFTCGLGPLTSADYLYRNIARDTMPEEEDVLEDFGFNHLTSFADRSKLLGLYKGLWYSDHIAAHDIHKWRVEGTLIGNIKKYYYQIPEQSRGGYFPWFLKNTNILEKSLTKEESENKMEATFFDQARLYLDKEDQHQDPKDLKPDAKRDCYYILAMSLHAASPNPIQELWYKFGFCTCHGEHHERQLGGLYIKLLLGNKLYEDTLGKSDFFNIPRNKTQTATFSEFWHAYESGSLIQLMDSKGQALKQERSLFPFLEGFLAVPPSGPRPSVWDLKQSIAINDPASFPPIMPVQADYGFINCETFEETCILLEIYKRLLTKASPLELHKACIAGKLFEFAERFHPMDDGYRRLMWNMYPLE